MQTRNQDAYIELQGVYLASNLTLGARRARGVGVLA